MCLGTLELGTGLTPF
uniref:Uncharacterized protein n=1 Tax=Anguilla anguilla TaxID=7936 RepID=A0A0E9RD97_ANGAN